MLIDITAYNTPIVPAKYYQVKVWSLKNESIAIVKGIIIQTDTFAVRAPSTTIAFVKVYSNNMCPNIRLITRDKITS